MKSYEPLASIANFELPEHKDRETTERLWALSERLLVRDTGPAKISVATSRQTSR